MGRHSRRRRQLAYKLVFPLGPRRERRYRKKRGIPDLPGLWKPAQHFYNFAQEYVAAHEDGWAVEIDDPGHRFIAWEMAVRYEAASREIEQHYIQICDGPSHEEWAERIKRIDSLLAVRERLSEIEQAVKPMFQKLEDIRLLTSCPRPRYQAPPERPILEDLANEYLS